MLEENKKIIRDLKNLSTEKALQHAKQVIKTCYSFYNFYKKLDESEKTLLQPCILRRINQSPGLRAISHLDLKETEDGSLKLYFGWVSDFPGSDGALYAYYVTLHENLSKLEYLFYTEEKNIRNYIIFNREHIQTWIDEMMDEESMSEEKLIVECAFSRSERLVDIIGSSLKITPELLAQLSPQYNLAAAEKQAIKCIFDHESLAENSYWNQLAETNPTLETVIRRACQTYDDYDPKLFNIDRSSMQIMNMVLLLLFPIDYKDLKNKNIAEIKDEIVMTMQLKNQLTESPRLSIR